MYTAQLKIKLKIFDMLRDMLDMLREELVQNHIKYSIKSKENSERRE